MRLVHVLAPVLIASACGGSSDGDDGVEPDGPSLEGDRYSLTWGPLTVPPQGEATRCVTLQLDNATPIKVHQLRNTLSTLSHHFIVYRENNPNAAVNTTPVDCQPFAGALNPQGASPIIVTQMAEEVLTLPDRVAYSFVANQKIRLEMHYINASDVDAVAEATSEFYAVPESEIDHEAEFLFIGSPDINYTLQPGQSQTLQAYFRMPANLDGIDFFAITGHIHQLGTDMDVSTAPSAGGTRTEVYNPTPYKWDEPDVVRAPFTVPSGGGFDFLCTWTNSTSTARTINFGESANDEMCFFWTYYYPSRGAKVCIHTAQFGGLDLCCPDAGSICDNLM